MGEQREKSGRKRNKKQKEGLKKKIIFPTSSRFLLSIFAASLLQSFQVSVSFGYDLSRFVCQLCSCVLFFSFLRTNLILFVNYVLVFCLLFSFLAAAFIILFVNYVFVFCFFVLFGLISYCYPIMFLFFVLFFFFWLWLTSCSIFISFSYHFTSSPLVSHYFISFLSPYLH